MAIKLTSSREAAKSNGIKVGVYGQSGAGKTTLCATTGAPTVIISAEGGLLSLRNHDIPVIEVKTLADVHEAYAFILGSDEAKQFEWVCLDSISEIAEVVLNYEKKTNKDARAAYGMLQEQMTELIRAFRDLPGRNVYFSAKQERIKDDTTGVVTYGPAFPGSKLSQGFAYFFDEVFVLRVEKAEDGTPMRMLQTQPDFQYQAKDRSGALAAWEEPNLAAIAAKILAG
jgi:phage nucleotide-binding protein